MRWFMNGILHGAIFVALHTFGALSAKSAKRLSRRLIWAFRLIARKTVRIIRANLKIAYPEQTEEEREKMIDDNIQNMIWSSFDFLRLIHKPEILEEMIEMPEGFRKEDLPKPPFVVCTSHVHGWEFLAPNIPRFYDRIAVVVGRFSYPALNDLLDRFRMTAGLRLIPRSGAMSIMSQLLKQNYGVGLLVDQNLSPSHSGVFVDFFGVPTTAPLTPVFFAEKLQIPIILLTNYRNPETDRFAFAYRTLTFPENSSRQEKMQIIITALEKDIRRVPAQYNWMYKRWAHIPSDADDALASKFPFYARKRLYKMDGSDARQCHHHHL